jgi:hypothetical protein
MSRTRKPKKATRAANKRAGTKSQIGKPSRALKPDPAVARRVAAVAKVPITDSDSEDNLQSLLKTLQNNNEPIEVRLAALRSLQAATFSAAAFASFRGSYIAALRNLAHDPNHELRQRVLGLLAREKDGFAQRELLDGLKNPTKALVPPEKALQLLSYDVHGDAYQVARDIVAAPPNPTAKREALRLLSADAASAPIFEKVLLDKNEVSENRQISAAALQAVQPERLRKYARQIVLDPSEYKEIQATSLTALTHFGDQAIAADKDLLRRVNDLRRKAPAKVKQSARLFLNKYGE